MCLIKVMSDGKSSTSSASGGSTRKMPGFLNALFCSPQALAKKKR